MKTKKHEFGSHRIPIGKSMQTTCMWGGKFFYSLLVTFVMLMSALPVRAGLDNNAPPRWYSADMDITPEGSGKTENPYMSIQVSHVNFDGDNFWWSKFDLVIDGVNCGSIFQLGITLGAHGDNIVWANKSGWIGPYYVTTSNHYQGNDKYKYTNINVYFPENTYGQTHTIEVDGVWVSKDGKTTTKYGPTQSRHIKFTSNPVTFTTPNGCGTYERTAPNQVTWRPSNTVTAATGYSHKYEFMLGGAGSWQTNSNPNASYILKNVSNKDRLDYQTRYVLYKTVNLGGIATPVTFTRNWEKTLTANQVTACTLPTDLQTECNLWTKSITLKWGKDSSGRLTNGKFYVFRYADGDPSTREKMATLNFNDPLQWTDNQVEYDKSYTYEVAFLLDTWDSSSPVSDLTASKTTQLARPESIFSNLTASNDQEDKIIFSWQHLAFEDAATHAYTLTVQRSTDGVNWSDEKYINVGSKQTTSGSYEDMKELQAFQGYRYRLKATVFDKDYVSGEVTGRLAGMSYVTGVSATRGTYSSMVKLKWDAKQVGNSLTYYDVQRRPLGSVDDDEWITLTTLSGTASSYSYDDVTALPGSYSQYRVVPWTLYNDNREENTAQLTDGFSVATGVVSGRISYGSGTAVEGVKVILKKNNAEGEVVNAMRSLLLSGTKAGLTYHTTGKTVRQLFGKDFSVQLYVNPSLTEMADDGTAYTLFDVAGRFGITLTYDAASDKCLLGTQVDGQSFPTTMAIPRGEWNHITCTYTAAGGTATFYVVNKESGLLEQAVATTGQSLTFDNGADKDAANVNLAYLEDADLPTYKGYVDEFRLFTKALAEQDILRNYNHPLSGSETALAIYWPMDEAIEGQNAQPIAYDFSKTNNVGNGRHALTTVPATSSANVPSEKQLSLMGYTNEQGTYEVRGIPFSGEGTGYTITPAMGAHQFSPGYQSRFVNMSMLNHSGIDFEDVSSFKVSGVAYYEHTTIPVPDASLYVDGAMAAKDGEPIMTNSQGKFTVDVPIGDHFIQIKKAGHTFLHNGRYPSDDKETGLRETFEAAKSNLIFYDQTLVTVAGRVAGGDLEYEKPIGLGQSTANIGKATLRLSLSNENGYLNVADQDPNSTTFTFEMSEQNREFTAASGRAYVPGGKNYITVETDPETGEWVAQLPPLRYDVTEVAIPTNKAITKADFSLPVIEATNPNLVYTDSVETDEGKVLKFDYHAVAKMEYKAPSTIEVFEREDGAFGMDSIEVKDENGTIHKVALYETDEKGTAILDADGKVNYTFGYPVYREMDSYRYHLYAYECYTNYDGTKPVVTEVPLAGKEVTIKNQFASTTAVEQETGALGDMVDDKLELDGRGRATYQFTVGFPNIQAPYTRGLSISYDNNGTEMSWSGNSTFQAIVLGGLPTGNNFVTQGPDNVLMVLRDPPGSGSSTTWSKGSTLVTSNSYTNEFHSELELGTTVYAGVKNYSGAGGLFIVINEVEAVANVDIGAQHKAQRTSYDSHTVTTTATRDISTSDAIDFVGAPGDVFIGSAKNLIFGACRAVNIKWNEVTGKPELVQEDAMSMGEEFTTGFAYTQNYITEVLIPNFKTLRDALLKPVASTSGINRPAKGEEPLYVTTLSQEDPHWGTSNSDEDVWGKQAVPFSKLKDGIYSGPSYTMLLPVDYEKDNDGLQDMVQFYNMQIARWEKELYKNEEAKVKAIQNREKWLKENHSFDAGTAISVSVTNEKEDSYTDTDVDEVNAVLGGETGHMFSGVGFEVRVEETIGRTFVDDTTHTHIETKTMSYTLLEDGGDYLSVDVFNAPDGFSPIFVTRAGATSCPYEDEVKTKFYQPGTTISAKTVQIEKPEIEAQAQLITGIPAGGEGTFKVNIRNNSDTGDDIWYDLLVTPDSNPDGLLVSMDGVNLNKGTSLLVKAGETMVKTLTVSQTNPDVLNYENVKLRIASQCQKDNTSTWHEIADTTEFSVFFQPACSDIQLASTHTLVNSDTETPVTLSIGAYNYSMASLRGVRLEYKAENDADFRTLQEYTKDKTRLASDPTLKELVPLEGTSKLTYQIDLRSDDFADKTYVFRAVTVCDQGGVEVNNESMEISIIRDMTRPMLIATPSPADGIFNSGDDLLLTFNEDIQGSILTKPNNFDVVGELNGREVAHDVALSLTGENTAKTEATMDLNGKSFTANLWLNYSSDGTLLSHGTSGSNFTVSIENGKLAVSVAGQKTISTETLPKDKWLYLNVAYEAGEEDGTTEPVLSAAYALDDTDVELIHQVATKAYQGNGPVSLGGKGLVAKVQELAFWNQNRSMTEAEADMYKTKSSYTSGLIGYWPLNEGHGEMATDYARSRHLTLPSQNAWWVNGENFALTLDGTKTAAVNIGALNTTGAEDYLIEAWFKADEQQDGVASLLGTQRMDLRLNMQGQMELLLGATADATANNTVLVGQKDLRDGQWHHVAVSVMKSVGGSGIVYIDGQQSKLVSASAMPTLYGDKLMLGGRRVETIGTDYQFTQQLKGAIDEVRIWKARRTADVIQSNVYTRVRTDEAGLVAYYPMERLGLDDYLQIVTTPTLEDQTGELKDGLTFFAADGSQAVSSATVLKSQNTAALKQAPRMENVQFSFVASERQIKVQLDELPVRMEGCHIYITSKGVKDTNGNVAQPITWSVYVQQNRLKWQEPEVAVTKSGVEAASFTAAIENIGSETEGWSLSGMPAWLTASVDGGSLQPLSTGRLTFTVAESLPVGIYEATVYLTGAQNIPTPLNICVVSEGKVPDWSVNARDFEGSMNVIGRVELEGVPLNNEGDLVAAFIGEECRGVAHLEYKERYGGHFVTMDIYGNVNDEAKAVTFRAYDALTGTLYPAVEPDRTIRFESLALMGKYADPVVLSVLDKVEQSTELKAGWNWLSFNVKADDMQTDAVFGSVADDVLIVKSQHDGWLMQEEGEWGGNLTADLSNSQMYAVKMLGDRTFRLVGQRVKPAECQIAISKGWNWTGYYGRQMASVGDALAGMQPQNGDILKGQSGVAYFDDYEWSGSIRTMEPGKGYMVKSEADDVRTFGYPTVTVAGAPIRLTSAGTIAPSAATTQVFIPVDYRTYAGNAIMTAQVVLAGEPVAGAEVGVFVDGECRTAALTDERGKAYLTIPGDDEGTLTLRVAMGHEELEVDETLDYEADAAYGSPRHPLLISLDEATAIGVVAADGQNEAVYDLQGRRLKAEAARLSKGVYIFGGKKKMVK